MTALTRDELIQELKAHGFRPQGTASMKWRMAWVKSNDTQTMFVLIRTRGIDLLITSVSMEEMLNSDRKLSVVHRADDRFVEYNYTESEVSIHSQALSAVSLFVSNQPIDESYFQKVGIGRSEWASKHGTKAKAREQGSMSSLYQDLSHGDGEPVYLSDGVWLGADGSLEDRGR